MTLLTTKELYRIFLASEFWIELSRRKRRKVKRCQRCNTKHRLQSHHVFYRENWFDTREEDLEVLCDKCHKRHHKKETVKGGRRKPSSPAFTRAQTREALGPGGITWKRLRQMRSNREITGKMFRGIAMANVWMNPPQAKLPVEERKFREFVNPNFKNSNTRKSKERVFQPGMYEGISARQAYEQIG